MLRTLTLIALIAVSSHCYGDETAPAETLSPAPKNLEAKPDYDWFSKLDGTTKKFIQDYLDQTLSEYERRIEKLEDELARRAVSPSPSQSATPTPLQPPPLPYAPPQVSPSPVQPSPWTQPALSLVPDSWQRFNFNGKWFYIVPVEQASAFAPSVAH